MNTYLQSRNPDFARFMITSSQIRAARALLGIDQKTLAERAGLSLPTIQRMEASDGVIRGNVDSLMKLIGALDRAGIELIGDNAASQGGGRGIRLKIVSAPDPRQARTAKRLFVRERLGPRRARPGGGEAAALAHLALVLGQDLPLHLLAGVRGDGFLVVLQCGPIEIGGRLCENDLLLFY